MLSQERHDLTADLQVGDVAIEVHPVEALQVQRHMAVEHIFDIDHLGHPATSSYPLHTMLNRKQAHRTSAGNLGGLRRARRRTSLTISSDSQWLTLTAAGDQHAQTDCGEFERARVDTDAWHRGGAPRRGQSRARIVSGLRRND